MVGIHTKNTTFIQRYVSLAVFIGFLCIQFHSFTHVHIDSFSTTENTHQNELFDSHQIAGQSSSDVEELVDCVDCVLTKHLQSNVLLSEFRHLDVSSGLNVSTTDTLLLQLSVNLFQLRAPPVYAV